MPVFTEEVERSHFAAVREQIRAVAPFDAFAALDIVREPEKCRLQVARRGEHIVSYLHLYDDGTLPVYRLAGDAEGAAGLVGSVGEAKSILLCQSHLREAVAARFQSAPSYPEHMMIVYGSNFTGMHSEIAARLSPDDAGQLFGLYASGEFAARTKFSSEDYYRTLLGKEVVFGAKVGGVLVSVATAYEGDSTFGVVGGVFTAPNQRGNGYGTAVTSAATGHVLSRAGRSMLYVRTNNFPAVHAYEKIGYRTAEDWIFFDMGTGIVP